MKPEQISAAPERHADFERSDSGPSHESTASTSPAPEGEPCPTPMTWSQVREAFASESTAWRLDRGAYCLTGQTCGEGPPLYFLNGTGGTSELYAPTVWLLRKAFRCVIYDYPSCADLPRKGVDHTMRRYVDDLFAVAEMHDDESVNLFASSFGGLVAFEALLTQPARVGKAALLGGFAHRRLSLCERLVVRAGRYLPGRLQNVPAREPIQIQSHLRWFPPADFSRWQFFLENTGSVPVADLAHRAALIRDTDHGPRLHEITKPVLLIRTEGEGAVLAECERVLEAGLQHAQTEWLHSCGHLPFLTNPHQLAKVVQQFLLSESVPASETVASRPR